MYAFDINKKHIHKFITKNVYMYITFVLNPFFYFKYDYLPSLISYPFKIYITTNSLTI